jgi:hypothetical protein
LLLNILFPKPKPKLLVGMFFGEKMPPPGPREPEPVTVAFLLLLAPLGCKLLWAPSLEPVCKELGLKKVLCVEYLWLFRCFAPAALLLNWLPPAVPEPPPLARPGAPGPMCY